VRQAERLEGVDSPAVVTELAVVVVLDHHRARFRRPCDRLAPPAGVERHAERELVCGREHDGRLVAQLADHGAAVGDRHAADGAEEVAMQGVAEAFDRHAPRRQDRRQHPQHLAEARTDHDVRGTDDDASHAPEIRGKLLAQDLQHTRVTVAERGVGSYGSARRAAASHAERGKAPRSGVPGRRSNRADASALTSPRPSRALSETHVPDDAYEEVAAEFSPEEVAALLGLIVTINAWNGLPVASRAWEPALVA
jgi:hypothetical protein